MFFYIEVAIRVENKIPAENPKSLERQCMCKEAAKRKAEQLGDQGGDGYTGISH